MDFKFGDVVYITTTGEEVVVYRIDEDSVTCDGARGSYGFDGEHVAHNYSGYQLKELIKTGTKDIAKAIRIQCFYALKEVERLEEEFKNKSITEKQLEDLLLKNYLFNISISPKKLQ